MSDYDSSEYPPPQKSPNLVQRVKEELKETKTKVELVLGLLGIGLVAWMGHDLVVYNPELQPYKFDRPAITAPLPQVETSSPTVASSPTAIKTALPTQTPDLKSQAITKLRATDQARTREDWLRDLEALPAPVRQSAVRIDLANSENDSFCSGTLVDIREYPGDSTKQIMILYTAAHCLTDYDYSKYTSAEIVQPHNGGTRVRGLDMASLPGRGDFGVIAVVTEKTDGIIPLGMENVTASDPFTPGLKLFALGFTDYAEKNDGMFPGQFQVIDGQLVGVFSEDMISLLVYQLDGAVAPGVSGEGFFDPNGRLMGTLTGPGTRDGRTVVSLYPLPQTYLQVTDDVVQLLLSR